ncbi:MAG: hypothetical protein ACRELA_18145 [Candidatus Rokuibacteriota bacterium]
MRPYPADPRGLRGAATRRYPRESPFSRASARGKLPKVALVAAMRKLLIAVYHVAKHRRPFIAVPVAAGSHS